MAKYVSKLSVPPEHPRMTREAFVQAYLDVMKLNGRDTSSMNDYEKRLVELFTARVIDPSFGCIRKFSTYLVATAHYFGCTEYKTTTGKTFKEFIIFEDEEIYFRPREPSSDFMIDIAVSSLHSEKYIPIRSFKHRPFRRINISGSTVYTAYIDNGSLYATEPEYQPPTTVVTFPERLSQCPARFKDVLYQEGTVKDGFIEIRGQKVKIDQPLLPTASQSNREIVTETIGLIMAYSNAKADAPLWIKETLTFYDKTEDKVFDHYVKSLGGCIGELNRLPEQVKATPYRSPREDVISSEVLTFALATRYRDSYEN